MKNIKKYYPLIVGLVLLLSVAAYGTRAYFSDSTREDAGIELQLGSVDIYSESRSWEYTPINKTSNKELLVKKGGIFVSPENFNDLKLEQTEIKNVLPGDSFSKVFTFENKSSLETQIKFNEEFTDKSNDRYAVKLTVIDANGGVLNSISTIKGQDVKGPYSNPAIPLIGGEKAQLALTITVQGGDQKKNEGEILPESIDLLEKFISVELSK